MLRWLRGSVFGISGIRCASTVSALYERSKRVRNGEVEGGGTLVGQGRFEVVWWLSGRVTWGALMVVGENELRPRKRSIHFAGGLCTKTVDEHVVESPNS